MLTLLMTLLALGLCLFALLYSLEILLGAMVKPVGHKPAVAAADYPLALVVPAHNEESVLAATLESLKADKSSEDRIIVVADNCSDNTASLAARHGAEVLERTSDTERGKGYALAHAVAHIQQNSNHKAPRAIAFIDADCWVEPGSLDGLRAELETTNQPVQLLYLIENKDTDTVSPGRRVAMFAMRIKNKLRARGLHALGCPVHISGSGIAFPADQISPNDLATGNIVEDLFLGLQFAAEGRGTRYSEAGFIRSYFPTENSAQESQRRRWIHGHLQLILSHAPKTILQCLVRGRPRAALLAADACIPPLTLYIAVNLALLMLAALLWGVGLITILPVWLGLAALGLTGIGLAVGWLAAGRDLLGLQEITGMIDHAGKAMRQSFSGLTNPEAKWVRTKRDDEADTDPK